MRKAGGVKVRSGKGTEGEGGAQVLPHLVMDHHVGGAVLSHGGGAAALDHQD